MVPLDLGAGHPCLVGLSLLCNIATILAAWAGCIRSPNLANYPCPRISPTIPFRGGRRRGAKRQNLGFWGPWMPWARKRFGPGTGSLSLAAAAYGTPGRCKPCLVHRPIIPMLPLDVVSMTTFQCKCQEMRCQYHRWAGQAGEGRRVAIDARAMSWATQGHTGPQAVPQASLHLAAPLFPPNTRQPTDHTDAPLARCHSATCICLQLPQPQRGQALPAKRPCAPSHLASTSRLPQLNQDGDLII